MSVAIPPILTAHHRFTVEQYRGMVHAGFLNEDDRVELINGEIIDMNPIGSPHSGTLRRVRKHFGKLEESRAVMGVGEPAILDEWNEPQPDLWLAKFRNDQYISEHPRPGDLLLVVEVSDSTLAYDKRVKLPVYARANIAEVWIVDVNAKTLTVYRNPKKGKYSSVKAFRSPEKVSPQAFEDVKVDLSIVFA